MGWCDVAKRSLKAFCCSYVSEEWGNSFPVAKEEGDYVLLFVYGFTYVRSLQLVVWAEEQ